MPDPGAAGTFLLDLDGTLVLHGTTTWLPGAMDVVHGLLARHYKLVFITRRGDVEFADHPVYAEAPTRKMLDDAGLSDIPVLFNCRNPRFIIDDSYAQAIERETDTDVEAVTLLRIMDEADHGRPF